jgi:hypothetical protein
MILGDCHWPRYYLSSLLLLLGQLLHLLPPSRLQHKPDAGRLYLRSHPSLVADERHENTESHHHHSNDLRRLPLAFGTALSLALVCSILLIKSLTIAGPATSPPTSKSSTTHENTESHHHHSNDLRRLPLAFGIASDIERCQEKNRSSATSDGWLRSLSSHST